MVAGAEEVTTTINAVSVAPSSFIASAPNWIVGSTNMPNIINQAFTTPTHSGGGTKKYVVRGSWVVSGQSYGGVTMEATTGMVVSTDSSATATTTPVTTVFLANTGSVALGTHSFTDIVDLQSATTYYMRVYAATRGIYNGSNYATNTIYQASITVEGLAA